MIEGPQRKLDWAHQHLQRFNSEWESFLEGKPYGASTYMDDKTGQEILKVKINKRPTDTDLSLIFGDFIHNLRASLDQLVWTIALSDKDTPAPDRDTAFPIFRLEDAKAMRKMVKCLPKSVRETIKELQPYQAGDGRHEHPLWIIRDLSNSDKHKRIPIVANEVTFTAGTPEQPALSGIRLQLSLEDEQELLWPSFPFRNEPDVKEQAALSFAVLLDDPLSPPFPVNLVDGLYYFVRDKVFGEIAKLLPEGNSHASPPPGDALDSPSSEKA